MGSTLVSKDNPASESLFGTLKYRLDMPVTHIEDISHARQWAELLVNWYNCEHRHSAVGAISYVTPQQHHSGQDIRILKQRSELYLQAQQKIHYDSPKILAIRTTLTWLTSRQYGQMCTQILHESEKSSIS